MKTSLHYSLYVSLLFLFFASSAQEIDPSFNPRITGTWDLIVQEGAAQPDGKIIIAGTFNLVNGSAVPDFARLNSNGSLDQTFVTGTGFNGEITEITLQPNGKILVSGYFTSYNNEPAPYLIRLNVDGTKDNSFNIGAGFDSYVADVTLQQDGKILVAGYFKKYNNTTANNVVRLNTDGTLDNTFSAGSGIGENMILDMEVQRDGKILIAGSFLNVNGQSKPRIARLNANGSLDATFNTGSGPNYLVTCISIQVINGEDRIVIGGSFDKYNDITSGRIARLKPDGSYDSEFQVGTGFGYNSVLDVLAYFDEIFVCTSSGFSKVSQTGVITPLYSQYVSNWVGDYGFGLIAVGGRAAQIGNVNRSGLAIVSTAGTPVSSFNPVLSAAGRIDAVVELSDGKLLIGGYFNDIDGHAAGNIARLNADGSFDDTFSTGGTGFSGSPSGAAEKIILQSDGKILVSGWFDTFNGVYSANLARLTRLNSNGSLDVSFNKTLYLGGPPPEILSLPDNKILISTSNHQDIIRFNANGSVDNSFNAGSPLVIPGGFYGLHMLSDGRILIMQTGTNNETVLKFLQSDGTVGTTFATIPGPGQIRKIIAGPNNVLFVSTTGNSSGSSASIYRVNANGTVLNPGVGLYATEYYELGSIEGMALSNNILLTGGYFKRIYYSGSFTNYYQSYFAAFDQNGVLRPGSTASFDAQVDDIFALSQGRLLIAGKFTKVNDVQKRNYVMLKTPANAPQAPSDMIGGFKNKQAIELTWVDNSNNEAAFEIQRASRTENNYATVHVAKPNETFWKDTLDHASSGYKYRVRATNFVGSSAYTESQLITGIEHESISTHALYPNPTNGIVYFNSEAIHPATIVSVQNTNGETKFTSKAEESIDLSFLPAGIYILKLQGPTSSTVTRVVKVN